MNLTDIEKALEKLEKAQMILAGARHWTVDEVRYCATRACEHIDSATDLLSQILGRESGEGQKS